MGFQETHQTGQYQRHAEIHEQQQGIDPDAVLGEIADALGLKGQVAQTDQRDQGRVLQVLYRQIAEAGHHFGDGLRDGDAPQGLARCEVQRLGRLVLVARHGLDRAAHDLGPVGADVQAQGQRARHDRRQTQVHAQHLSQHRQGEEQPEQLHQQ